MTKMTKTQVIREFKYIRELLREGTELMSSKYDNDKGLEQREMLANELVAAANIYTTWVEQSINDLAATPDMKGFDVWLKEDAR